MKLLLHSCDSQKRSVLFLPHQKMKYIYKFVFAVATPTWQNCNLVTCDVTSDQATVEYKLQCLHLAVNK